MADISNCMAMNMVRVVDRYFGNLQEQFPNIHAIIMDDDYKDGDVAHERLSPTYQYLRSGGTDYYVGSKRNDMREWLSAANIVMALANEPESCGYQCAASGP
jgi:hypothetical protein